MPQRTSWGAWSAACCPASPAARRSATSRLVIRAVCYSRSRRDFVIRALQPQRVDRASDAVTRPEPGSHLRGPLSRPRQPHQKGDGKGDGRAVRELRIVLCSAKMTAPKTARLGGAIAVRAGDDDGDDGDFVNPRGPTPASCGCAALRWLCARAAGGGGGARAAVRGGRRRVGRGRRRPSARGQGWRDAHGLHLQPRHGQDRDGGG